MSIRSRSDTSRILEHWSVTTLASVAEHLVPYLGPSQNLLAMGGHQRDSPSADVLRSGSMFLFQGARQLLALSI